MDNRVRVPLMNTRVRVPVTNLHVAGNNVPVPEWPRVNTIPGKSAPIPTRTGFKYPGHGENRGAVVVPLSGRNCAS